MFLIIRQMVTTSMVQEVGCLVLRVGVRGWKFTVVFCYWKLQNHVTRKTLPIHLFRHFCLSFSHNTQRHRWTDRQIDRLIVPIACMQYDRLKMKLRGGICTQSCKILVSVAVHIILHVRFLKLTWQEYKLMTTNVYKSVFCCRSLSINSTIWYVTNSAFLTFVKCNFFYAVTCHRHHHITLFIR